VLPSSALFETDSLPLHKSVYFIIKFRTLSIFNNFNEWLRLTQEVVVSLAIVVVIVVVVVDVIVIVVVVVIVVVAIDVVVVVVVLLEFGPKKFIGAKNWCCDTQYDNTTILTLSMLSIIVKF
jgi:hypothetical protein